MPSGNLAFTANLIVTSVVGLVFPRADLKRSSPSSPLNSVSPRLPHSPAVHFIVLVQKGVGSLRVKSSNFSVIGFAIALMSGAGRPFISQPIFTASSFGAKHHRFGASAGM